MDRSNEKSSPGRTSCRGLLATAAILLAISLFVGLGIWQVERRAWKLDLIAREHGDEYINGIQPSFDPLKARHFNSSWNWVRQDALTMWFDILCVARCLWLDFALLTPSSFGRLTTVDRDITARCIVIMNRADPALLDYMQYVIDNTPTERGETYVLAKAFGQTLLDNCREMVGQAPLYKDGECILRKNQMLRTLH